MIFVNELKIRENIEIAYQKNTEIGKILPKNCKAHISKTKRVDVYPKELIVLEEILVLEL